MIRNGSHFNFFNLRKRVEESERDGDGEKEREKKNPNRLYSGKNRGKENQ